MAGGLLQQATYRDAKGNTARVSFYVADVGDETTQAAAATAVLTAIDAITNAHRQSTHGPLNAVSTEVIYGTAATFGTVEDKATFTFQTATGDIHRFRIPAPLASIFLADGETVDGSNTHVTAYTSAVVANCVSRDGEAIAFGAVGIRQRVKMRRRINVFTKDPALTGPDE